MKQSDFIPVRDLPKLRHQICLGSLFIKDYENDMGFTPESVCDFFDGYLEFLCEEVRDITGIKDPDMNTIIDYDNSEAMVRWYNCFEDFPFEEVTDGE